MNKLFLLLFPVVIALQGCGPLLNLNIKVIGEQTSLENQVLGNYAELGNELQSYGSVRGVDPSGALAPPKETTTSQQQVFAALQNRRYNNDDLMLLLRTGVVGEAATGFLDQRKTNLEGLPFGQEQVTQLIEEENRDRTVLLERLQTTVFTEAENQQQEIIWVFATINQNAAPTGSAIQARTGEWSIK